MNAFREMCSKESIKFVYEFKVGVNNNFPPLEIYQAPPQVGAVASHLTWHELPL